MKVYRSNLFAWWTPERQDDALDDYKPGWRSFKVFSDDDLNDRELRSSYQDKLTEQAIMLRASTRKVAEDILVASLAVLAKTDAHMRQLIAAWHRARTKSRLEGAAKRGGEKSASIRKAKSLEGAKRIWDRWKLSSDEWPTKILLAEAEITRNTMNAHYGCTREVSQRRYQASLKRKATKGQNCRKGCVK